MDSGHKKTSSPADFEEALQDLRRSGCNALIVGDLPQSVRDYLTRRCFGASDESRFRVLGLTHGGAQMVPPPASDGVDHRKYIQVATQAINARCGVITESTTGSEMRSHLDTFQRELFAAVDLLERTAGGFDPAQLRVCIDSLGPLVDTCQEEALLTFIRKITTLVSKHRGMSHLYLPLPRHQSFVERLVVDFEIVMTVEEQYDRRIQHWELQEHGIHQPITLEI